MILPTPRSTRTDTLLPYATLFRSISAQDNDPVFWNDSFQCSANSRISAIVYLCSLEEILHISIMSIDFTGEIYRNSIRNYWNINASVSCDGIIISVGNISRATIFKFRIRGHDDYCPTGCVTPINRSLWAL